MSIIIVNSSLDDMYGKDATLIAFSKKGTVNNIEESNLIIHTNYLLRDEPLKSSATIFKIYFAIITLRGGEVYDAFKFHSVTIQK